MMKAIRETGECSFTPKPGLHACSDFLTKMTFCHACHRRKIIRYSLRPFDVYEGAERASYFQKQPSTVCCDRPSSMTGNVGCNAFPSVVSSYRPRSGLLFSQRRRRGRAVFCLFFFPFSFPFSPQHFFHLPPPF